MKYYDADRFELEFDDDTSIEERDYCTQLFKNVNAVARERNHCTSCSIHIGSSPSAENDLKMHSILRVTQCGKCYRFYNSGAFVKGNDGNEIHCRWCGQGGELYCCSACPYVFCQKCIVRNLTADGLKLVLLTDNWKCYACEPKTLYPLRAQHWALVNFIKKQIKSLEMKMSKGLRDQDAIAFHMKKDLSICCPSKATLRKRKLPNAVDDKDELWSEKSQSSKSMKEKRREIRKSRPYKPSVPAKKYKAKLKQTSKSISNATSTSTAIPGHALKLEGGAESPTTMTPDEQEKFSFRNAIQPPIEPISCPSTSVGRGRTQIQSQVFKAMHMCRQVDEKLIELMNSKTYKAANSMNDINELYTCLSHLLTYTNDRVQHLKENCMDDMRQFGFENNATDATDATDGFDNNATNATNSTDGFENNGTDPMDAAEENLHLLDEDENEIEIGEFTIKMDPDDEVETTIILDDSD